MSAEALAALHASAFDAPWSAAEFQDLIAAGALAIREEDGFILIRVAAGEAEILTLAVAPAARRQGLGRALVEAAVREAKAASAETLFLEVASDNAAAIGLYAATGFEEAGRRRNYYRRKGLRMQDAIIFARALNRG